MRVKRPSSSGMLPVRRLDCSSRRFRVGRRPRVLKIVPVSWFSPMPRRAKLVNDANSLGIGPVKLLLPIRSSFSSEVSKPSSVGSVPVSWFSWQANSFNKVRRPISLGKGPVRVGAEVNFKF